MKTLKITAVHLKTNKQITEIDLEKIEDKGSESQGYRHKFPLC